MKKSKLVCNNLELKQIIKEKKHISYTYFIQYFLFGDLIYYISIYCIKKNLKPNFITILMIPCILLGSILVYNGTLDTIILSFIFFALFEVLDFSDGLVARFTNTFSKYGKQLDYLIHTCFHPIVIYSFMIAFSRVYETQVLNSIFILFVFIESINRSLINLCEFKKDVQHNSVNIVPYQISIKKIFLRILKPFIDFPDFFMLTPCLLVVDMILYTKIAVIYLYIFVLISFFHLLYAILKAFVKFYLS